MLAQKITKKKRSENRTKMFEMAKNFIGKKCVIYTFNSDYVEGIIKEVTDGAILLERKGRQEAINLDFVVRIKETPEKK
jgi:ferredoxin-fold anticodon binding domain-containing protein